MSEQFHFEDYRDHNFYHIRLGRGAVVVAVSKNPENGIEAGKVNSDLYVAGYFCNREQNLEEKPQNLDPVR